MLGWNIDAHSTCRAKVQKKYIYDFYYFDFLISIIFHLLNGIK